MAQYNTGTVSVTNGSATVTGSGTLWDGNITAGDLFTVASTGTPYFVGSIDSDTQITLTANYAGTTASGVTYALHRDFTEDNIPLLSKNDIETGTIFSRAMAKIQELINVNKTEESNLVGVDLVVDNSIVLNELSGVTFAGITTPVAISNIYEPFKESNWPLMMQDKSWYDEEGYGVDGAYHGTVTTTQRNALTPSQGDVCYNSTTAQFEKYSGSAWALTYRGPQREFPARAVAVAEAAKVIIYDLTGSEPVMWKVRNTGAYLGWTDITCVSLKGGILLNGSNNGISNGDLYGWDFINDETWYMTSSGKFTKNTGSTIKDGNTAGTGAITLSSTGLVQTQVNDIATTQLDNAPVDEYGVKGVTWAVATDGGVSVGRTDGNVWDIGASDGVPTYNTVHFSIDNRLYLGKTDTNGASVIGSIPNTDYATNSAWRDIVLQDFDGVSDLRLVGSGDSIASIVSKNAIATSLGLTLLKENLTTPAEGLVNYLTTSYQSGWMAGDIKGAWLADNDDTNVTGSELAPDLTTYADQAAAEADGWTFTAAASFDAANDEIDHASGTAEVSAFYANAVVSGVTYTVTYTIANYSGSGNFRFRLGGAYARSVSANGTYTDTITATGTTLDFQAVNSTCGGSLKAISVKLADSDRSVNNNGLQVNGTITKTRLGGADSLVAYSGFSAANYLEQPYNADLDFGTGDFYVMGWAKVATDGRILEKSDGTATNMIGVDSNAGVFRFFIGTAAELISSSSASTSDVWTFITAKRESGVIYLYINAVLESSAAGVSDVTDTSSYTYIGESQITTIPLGGSLALWRIGSGAPSAEDIEYIYKQEKPLIVNGADAVLGGSSDAIAAIAWDDYAKQLKVQSGDYLTTIQGSTVVSKEASTATLVSVSDNEVIKG